MLEIKSQGLLFNGDNNQVNINFSFTKSYEGDFKTLKNKNLILNEYVESYSMHLQQYHIIINTLTQIVFYLTFVFGAFVFLSMFMVGILSLQYKVFL